jgi:hypothetical protein
MKFWKFRKQIIFTNVHTYSLIDAYPRSFLFLLIREIFELKKLLSHSNASNPISRKMNIRLLEASLFLRYEVLCTYTSHE